MRTLLVSALALGAFTSAAFAEPLVLSDIQLDALTAGQDVNQSNSAEVNITQSNTNTGPNEGDVSQSNSATVTITQSNTNNPPAPPPAEG
jgi:hypothetical protein